MSDLLRSESVSIEAWRGSYAIYRHQRETIPTDNITEAEWAKVSERFAPSKGPQIATDKKLLTYFTLGLLREEMYSGKTAERMAKRGETYGLMRSTAHITESTTVCFDFDGISKDQVRLIGNCLLANGITFLLYTTHSHGHHEKPGCRVRLIFPIDKSLDRAAYSEVHNAMNDQLFDGLADRTGKSLTQQQSLWAAHPDRRHLAKCVRRDGGVFGISKFWARSPIKRIETKTAAPRVSDSHFNLPKPARYRQALPFLRANTYEDWAKGIIALKALAHHIGEDAARGMAVSYASTSPEDSTRALRAETDQRYDPGEFFDRTTPSMNAEQASNLILALAYKTAVGIVDDLRGQPTCSEAGRQAAVYLAAHYPRVWAQMSKEVA